MEKRLLRNKQEDLLGGVCVGLADYFNLNPMWFRAIFFLLFTTGVGFILYLMLWLAIPPNHNSDCSNTSKQKQDTSVTLGFFFIAVGCVLLLNEFRLNPNWLEIKKIWPLAIIIPATLMIIRSNKNKKTNI